jgi:hypothetical protein
MLCFIMLSVIMPSAIYAKCHYAECCGATYTHGSCFVLTVSSLFVSESLKLLKRLKKDKETKVFQTKNLNNTQLSNHSHANDKVTLIFCGSGAVFTTFHSLRNLRIDPDKLDC